MCLIGRYSVLKPLARKLRAVRVSVLCVKSPISFQSVLNQDCIDLNVPSSICKEACEVAGVKELTMA